MLRIFEDSVLELYSVQRNHRNLHLLNANICLSVSLFVLEICTSQFLADLGQICRATDSLSYGYGNCDGFPWAHGGFYAVDRRDRQTDGRTDGRTPYRYIDAHR